MQHFLSRTLGLLALLALLTAPAALAQVQQQPPPPPPPETDFSEEEIYAAAEVFVKLEALQQEYRAQLSNVEGPEEARQIQSELQTEAMQIVEDHEGIDTDTYDQLVRAAQTDQELRQELLTTIEEIKAEQEGDA